MGREAARVTSMARMTFAVSLAWMRAAEAGSSRFRMRCKQKRTPAFCLAQQAIAQGRRPLRSGKQSLQQSTEIKPSASGDNRQPASPHDAGDGLAGGSRVVARRVEGIGIHYVEQVMRYQLPLFG